MKLKRFHRLSCAPPTECNSCAWTLSRNATIELEHSKCKCDDFLENFARFIAIVCLELCLFIVDGRNYVRFQWAWDRSECERIVLLDWASTGVEFIQNSILDWTHPFGVSCHRRCHCGSAIECFRWKTPISNVHSARKQQQQPRCVVIPAVVWMKKRPN